MTTDVNEAFAAEKIAQLDSARAASEAAAQSETDRIARFEARVAAGEMVQTGPNTYRVTQGWDAGETFTVNRNAAGQVAEVVANHGLDTMADGRTALYSAVPAWHSLGQVIPGGTSDVEEVLKLSGLDFTVELVPTQYTWGEQTLTVEDSFTTVRNDTGAALGVVGSRYTPVQNSDGFGFLQELVGDFGVKFESAGALRGGRKVFVSIRLPKSVVVDAEGINDEILPFVAVLNDHAGTGSFQAVVTPWRPVCKNTERFAVRDAHTRWSVRHTRGAADKVREARRTLNLSINYFEEWAAEENQLAQTDLAIDDFRKVLADLWPEPEADKKAARTIHEKRSEMLTAMFHAETKRLGGTAYAAERTITDYLDHVAPKRPGKSMSEEVARATALLEGSDDEMKSKAHERLLLVRR
ncbi:DUF932 domain-containing protein [Streptomyces sp. NPDC093261]|uniref:DUF932 domain-containing protein n=1 Tax=Streptomyces sp. NPDC093261 TaxID=3366037 RepID=UPI0038278782